MSDVRSSGVFPGPFQPFNLSGLIGHSSCPGVINNKEQADEARKQELDEQEKAKKRKACGLPPIDPDALPSTTVAKHMTLCGNARLNPLNHHPRSCLAKMITKASDLHKKFKDAKDKTEVQVEFFGKIYLGVRGLRLEEALHQLVKDLQKSQADLSKPYSQGIVNGYTKEFLVCL